MEPAAKPGAGLSPRVCARLRHRGWAAPGAGLQAAPTARPASSPGWHPALPRVTGPAGCASTPVPVCPPDGFCNPAGKVLEVLCPPPHQVPRVSPARRLCSALAGLGRSGGEPEIRAGNLLALLDTPNQRLPFGRLMGFWALRSFCSRPGHRVARS